MSKMTKKEQILETALNLFATQGVGNTSTAQITKEAGVAEGTLFVHFKNKAALVDAVYTHIKRHEAEVFLTAIDLEKDAETNIKALSKKMTQHFLENYNELLFIENVKHLNLVSKEAVEEANKSFAPVYEAMAKWHKSGQLKSVDMPALGAMTWAMLVSLTQYCKENNKKVTDKLIEPIWDALRPN